MRNTLVTLVVSAGSLAAQTFYIPDNLATTGTCNVIPFGSTTSTSTFHHVLLQQVVTAADLGNAAGVITGLGFAACATGKTRTGHLQVIMDHAPPSTVLSTTFANNLTANAIVMLDQQNYVWNTSGNSWNEIGLQNVFAYDGVSDLVIQVLSDQGISPAGFHRSSTRQRVYATGWIGTPPATGSTDNAGQKLEIGMLAARISQYGDGCTGSSGLPPVMATNGTPVLGTSVDLNVTQAPPTSPAFVIMGFTNGFPFPLDLGVFGMPTCFQYTDVVAATLQFTDAAGVGTFTFAVPLSSVFSGLRLYSQWACVDPGANTTGLTTSDYVRLLLGT